MLSYARTLRAHAAGEPVADALCGAGGMTLAQHLAGFTVGAALNHWQLAPLKLRPVLRWEQTELFGKEVASC